jgi:hypothetical protein
MKTKRVLQFIVIWGFSLMVSCEKDQRMPNADNLLGTWVSLNKSDTLTFVDKTNLWRKSDHYDYMVMNDSIKIGYSGKLYIYVLPTNHKYYLGGNNLSIDFSNRNCYGFELKLISYSRE